MGASAVAFNALYRIARKEHRSNEVAFLSRQTGAPSYDYLELAREFEQRGWSYVMHLRKIRARNMPVYVWHVLREIGLLGKCKIVVIDRYDPVISLIDFECEHPEAQANARKTNKHGEQTTKGADAATIRAHASSNAPRKGLPLEPLNTEFPTKPVVLQVWHAFGAYKNFGFQSNDTPEGHPTDFTDVYRIHRNCSWVFCSGEGARKAYAEAFSCPVERVVALVRPEYDELMSLRAARTDAQRTKGAPLRVLMAPTLRYDDSSAHPFRDLYENRAEFEEATGADVTWSFHPLEEGLPAPGNVSSALLETDCVVTDYSSIAYEAFLLGIPVFFFVPDIEDYLLSPGLNANPMKLCPEICTFESKDLAERLHAFATNPDTYPQSALDAFAATGFDEDLPLREGTAASRIVDFALSHLP